MQVLVTGAAGFIGFYVSKFLVERGDKVVGIDNVNDYYDTKLKLDRLEILERHPEFSFEKIDLSDTDLMQTLFRTHQFDGVVNLAAQAGVRYSIDNPHVYIESNILGFLNVLEGVRQSSINHLVYASSSSVYGANTLQPFSEHHNVDHPVSLYAASKKANELMAHSYSHLYGIKTTGLRFFTVYGPWGRPDMAYWGFTKKILAGEPIDIFNNGQMQRDFPYIDDIVEAVVKVLDNPAEENLDWDGNSPDPASSYAKFRIFNIGNNNPVKLLDFVKVIEEALGLQATKNFLPIQTGDMVATYADISELETAIGFKPKIDLSQGMTKFVNWYQDYYKLGQDL